MDKVVVGPGWGCGTEGYSIFCCVFVFNNTVNKPTDYSCLLTEQFFG